MAVRLSALRVGRAFLAERSTGIYFCWRLSKLQGLVQPEELIKLEKNLRFHWDSIARPSAL
jgi:hypothetical protein